MHSTSRWRTRSFPTCRSIAWCAVSRALFTSCSRRAGFMPPGSKIPIQETSIQLFVRTVSRHIQIASRTTIRSSSLRTCAKRWERPSSVWANRRILTESRSSPSHRCGRRTKAHHRSCLQSPEGAGFVRLPIGSATPAVRPAPRPALALPLRRSSATPLRRRFASVARSNRFCRRHRRPPP